MKKGNKQNFKFYCDPEILDAIKKRAKHEHSSISGLIAKAVYEYLHKDIDVSSQLLMSITDMRRAVGAARTDVNVVYRLIEYFTEYFFTYTRDYFGRLVKEPAVKKVAFDDGAYLSKSFMNRFVQEMSKRKTFTMEFIEGNFINREAAPDDGEDKK